MPAKAKTISNSSTLFFMGEVLLAQSSRRAKYMPLSRPYGRKNAVDNSLFFEQQQGSGDPDAEVDAYAAPGWAPCGNS